MGQISDSVDVGLGERSYRILLGSEILTDLPTELAKINFPAKLAIITNTDLAELYGQPLLETFQQAGLNACLIAVPEGEEHKNLQTLQMIYDHLIAAGFDRSSGLIALGGGVIGDTVGFAAATFLRGVPFVQIPTTLLSQVDSSVGGKTGVNHPLGKNLIGSFYQPRLVQIDIETLKTLDHRELSAGLAEVVKYGVIRDEKFFCWLEENAVKLLQLDRDCLIFAIKKSCQIKADIVEIDEREGSIRAILNYGHTFGHAIEALSGYGQWRHGEAVAAGMVKAAQISQLRGLCGQEDIDRIVNLLMQFELPTEPPQFGLDEYVEAMQRDKKVKHGQLTMVLNEGIGASRLVEIEDIKTEFTPFISDREN